MGGDSARVTLYSLVRRLLYSHSTPFTPLTPSPSIPDAPHSYTSAQRPLSCPLSPLSIGESVWCCNACCLPPQKNGSLTFFFVFESRKRHYALTARAWAHTSSPGHLARHTIELPLSYNYAHDVQNVYRHSQTSL